MIVDITYIFICLLIVLLQLQLELELSSLPMRILQRDFLKNEIVLNRNFHVSEFVNAFLLENVAIPVTIAKIKVMKKIVVSWENLKEKVSLVFEILCFVSYLCYSFLVFWLFFFSYFGACFCGRLLHALWFLLFQISNGFYNFFL